MNKMPSDSAKKTRMNYSKEDLKEAIEAISAGMPILKASAKYKIPRSTLCRKKLLKNIDKKPGPDTVLTANEEETLVQWIFDCSNVGMPVAKQQLLNSVSLLLKSLNRDSPFTNGRPGNHWWRNFLARNKKIVQRISENMATTRAVATEGGIRNWFNNVEGYLQDKKLLDIHPSRVFSSHTVLLANPKRNENNENLCVQMTGNAAGQLAYPMIIFTWEKIPSKVRDAMPPGWMIGQSENNGNVTAENFLEYIKDCFYPWLVVNKIEFPVVLFLNGRVPHVTLLLTDFCTKRKIELIALHPNSLNLIHPLEIFFEPLKKAWEDGLKKQPEAQKGAGLPKENIAPFLKSTLDTLNVTEFLNIGFASCGLYPLSADFVDFKKLPEKSSPVDKVPKERVEFGSYVLTEPHQLVEHREKLFDRQFLQILEERLDPNTLKEFKNAEKANIWTGAKEDTALFYFWKSTLDRALVSCKTDDIDGWNSHLNTTDNNVDFSDDDFDDANNFLEIHGQPEDSTGPTDPIKIFLKTENQ